MLTTHLSIVGIIRSGLTLGGEMSRIPVANHQYGLGMEQTNHGDESSTRGEENSTT